jgi:hypothetical protein
MDTIIEFNDAAFNHNVSKDDIRKAFDTAYYDGWFNEREQKDQYLLIGFYLKGNPIEIMYNIIDNETISVFHAMPCRSIFFHLLPKEENNG